MSRRILSPDYGCFEKAFPGAKKAERAGIFDEKLFGKMGEETVGFLRGVADLQHIFHFSEQGQFLQAQFEGLGAAGELMAFRAQRFFSEAVSG